MNRLLCFTIAWLVLGGAGSTADRPLFDEGADARRQIRATVAEASKTGQNIVLVFGANW